VPLRPPPGFCHTRSSVTRRYAGQPGSAIAPHTPQRTRGVCFAAPSYGQRSVNLPLPYLPPDIAAVDIVKPPLFSSFFSLTALPVGSLRCFALSRCWCSSGSTVGCHITLTPPVTNPTHVTYAYFPFASLPRTLPCLYFLPDGTIAGSRFCCRPNTCCDAFRLLRAR